MARQRCGDEALGRIERPHPGGQILRCGQEESRVPAPRNAVDGIVVARVFAVLDEWRELPLL